MLLRILVLALAWCAAAAPAAGQSLSAGALQGTVRDSLDQPLGGARVVAREEATSTTRSAATSPSGEFHFAFLPPGRYSLLVEQLFYRPAHVTGIPVRAGQTARVRVALSPAEGAVARVDSVAYPGAGAGVDASGALLARLPLHRRDLGEVARLSSLAGPGLEQQGLPASMTGVRVDGTPLVLFPVAGPAGLATAAFPLNAFAQAGVAETAVDVEWGGTASGSLQGFTRRPGAELRGEAFGSWGSLALPDGVAADETPVPLQGGIVLSGPLLRDTAGFTLGAEFSRAPESLGRSWTSGPAAERVIAAARDAHGVELGGGALPESRALSVFGGLGWRLGETGLLGVSAHFASLSTGYGDAAGPLGPVPALDATEGWASVSFASRVGERATQELRVALETSGRSRDEASLGAAGAMTWLAADGVRLGPDADGPARLDQLALSVTEAVTIRTGDHAIKLGVAGTLRSMDQDFAPAARFHFGGADQLAAGAGYLEQTLAGERSSAVRTVRGGAFVQDVWSPAPGLELLLGLRADLEGVAADDLEPDSLWVRLTGLDADAVAGGWALLQPRFALNWDVGDRHQWVLSATAGLHAGMLDPLLLGELGAFEEGAPVRRGLASLTGWPDAPAAGAVPEAGATLTLPSPDLRAPRTFRATAGVSRSLGAASALHLSALYRHTDQLPRRADLNLVPGALGTGPLGLPVFGTLEYRDGLLVAEPGSNRRFTEYDRVYAINPDGWSRHLGVTARLEHRAAEALQLFGGYTFSRTEDNWPGGGTGDAEAQLLGATQDAEWVEGRSDYDVPHRAVLGAELAAPAGIRLAALGRYRSGLPFTPVYAPGIDADGDGVFGNDPAALGAAVPGAAELLSGAGCASGQGVAERNSCRTDAVYSLDARLTWRVFGGPDFAAELVLDGLNLLASEEVVPDRALYRLDPAAAGPALVANDNFGQPVLQSEPARVLRLGLRVSY